MKAWDPKVLWEEVKRALRGWSEDDESESGEHSSDPTLLFHLMFTAPMVLGLLLMARRA